MAFILVAQSASADVDGELSLPDGFAHPNGITGAPDGTIYVGSVTTGDQLRIAPDGSIETWFEETETVFAGTSLRLDPATGILWVASPDFLGREVDGRTVRRAHRLAAIDVSRGEEVWSSSMPDGGFVNDIALDGDGGSTSRTAFGTASCARRHRTPPSRWSRTCRRCRRGNSARPGSSGCPTAI